MAMTCADNQRLSLVGNLLFPHTPIEIKTFPHDHHFHIYMEGEWHSKVDSSEEIVKQVRWLTKTYGDDWYYPSTRVEPDWEGWKKISQSDLSNFREGCGEE